MYKGLRGDFCDFGCYDGLASKFINEYCDLKSHNIDFYLFDVFDNPPLSEKFPKHSLYFIKMLKIILKTQKMLRL